MKTDVCLILEGTYPYVYGGVSAWVHQLVRAYPDLTFSIVHISSSGDTIKTPKYEVPSNILEFREVFVHDPVNDRKKVRGNQEKGWKAFYNFYRGLENGDYSNFKDYDRYVINPETRVLSIHDILYSKRSWKYIVDYTNQHAPTYPFIDYYWTMVFMHLPLVNLYNARIPEASMYHTVCTGYAGFLASIAKVRTGAPMMLTEHGIYTLERKIEISRSKWIGAQEEGSIKVKRSMEFLKELWVKKFNFLSQITYHFSDKITTLFEGNRRLQMEGGALPEKIELIPNGIELPSPQKLQKPPKKRPNTIGFIGRIVPIKDVKTLIRAMKIVVENIPDATLQVLGDGEETREYFEECKVLVQMLDLGDSVNFTGNVNVNNYYPLFDVVVLTSISEAQPLSLLEAMSYGIPVVSSKVGACKELIEGREEEGGDKLLGQAGIVTDVGNPNLTAQAIMRILKDVRMHNQMSKAGKERVQKYYTAGEMIDRYRNLYQSFTYSHEVTGQP